MAFGPVHVFSYSLVIISFIIPLNLASEISALTMLIPLSSLEIIKKNKIKNSLIILEEIV